LEQHVDHAAREGAVEAAGAAQDQNDHHAGAAVEVEYAERRVGIGLREQRAGDAGNGGRDGVDDDEAPAHRRADRMHAIDVFADAGERPTKGRVDDAAHHVEQNEQHHTAIDIIGAAVEVVVEHAEQRPDGDAGNAVVAAGEVLEQVADFLQQN